MTAFLRQAALFVCLLLAASCGGPRGPLSEWVGFWKCDGGGWRYFEVRDQLLLVDGGKLPIDEFEVDGNVVSFGHRLTQAKIIFESRRSATVVFKVLGFGVDHDDCSKVPEREVR